MQKNSNAAIFAIRPEYAKSILDGTKKYEYRKVACKKPIEKMLIYATAPIMQVVGEADSGSFTNCKDRKLHNDGSSQVYNQF